MALNPFILLNVEKDVKKLKDKIMILLSAASDVMQMILYSLSWRTKTADGLLFGLLYVKVLVVLCTV